MATGKTAEGAAGNPIDRRPLHRDLAIVIGRRQVAQLSPGAVCSWGMNTFLKILLIAVLALLAIKFIPIVALAAFVGLLIAAVLGVVGLSLVAALLAVGICLAMALSPIWIPVLVVMGLISLFRKLGSKPAAPPAVAA